MNANHAAGRVDLEVPQALLLAFTFNALGSFYWSTVGLQIAPWRSLLVGLSIGVTLALVFASLDFSPIPPFVMVFLSVIVAQTVELWNHHTFVREGALIVQYGFLGNLYESFPISEVRDVQVSSPLLGQIWNVGDINVLGYGWGTTLPAVRRPEESAKKIVALSAIATRERTAPRTNEGAL